MTAPRLVAHRGYTYRYPDNSLAGLRAALDAGARFVEVDVQLSTDLTPWLFHDRDLVRVCGRLGKLTELDDAGVAALRASEEARFGAAFADEPVARLAELAELLRARPDVFAFVELKPVAVERFGAATVAERALAELAGLEGRCAVISFRLDVLREVRARASFPVGPILEAWSELEGADVAALDPAYVFCDTKLLPRGPLAPLPGVPRAALAVYEVVDPAEARDLFARGASFVETFRWVEMTAALADEGAGR
ncbi:MAG: glycerophosphodiester phosphodiesterase [Planctomycetes bacterium]|nr:glycerophosphodiester phosphodiesterase [Planctomycetota bacterium]